MIRTCCLSKRWINLWTLLPYIILLNGDNNDDDDEYRHVFFSLVDKAITQSRHLKLKKFQLSTSYDCRFESQVNNWIHYAISCNVKDLDLSLWDYARIVLDGLFFTNSQFTHLKLSCNFVNPTGAFGWNNLKSLSLSEVELNENLIQNILSGSPLLQTFKLIDCYGRLEELNITSESVQNFVISGDNRLGYKYKHCPPEHVYLNAPNILSLTIRGIYMWELYLTDVSSLVEANLDYINNDYNSISWSEDYEDDEEYIMLKHYMLQLNWCHPLSRLGVVPLCIEQVADDEFHYG
ncbi:F-box protein-like protein [Tanacetum coccineum]